MYISRKQNKTTSVVLLEIKGMYFFLPKLRYGIFTASRFLLTIQNSTPITHLLSPQHEGTHAIDLCDRHCEHASPGGSATDCVCVFPDGH